MLHFNQMTKNKKGKLHEKVKLRIRSKSTFWQIRQMGSLGLRIAAHLVLCDVNL